MLKSSYTVQDGKIKDASNSSDQGVLIPVSGEKPSSGELHYSNNVLKGGCLVIGDYQITFNGTEASTVKGDCSDYEYVDPDVPTMAEMCPGCKYGMVDASLGSTLTNGYNDSYLGYSNGDVFLGYIINSNSSIVERIFVCGVESGKSFCLEAFDATKKQKNIDIIKAFFPGVDITSEEFMYGSDVGISYEYNTNGFITINNNMEGCMIGDDIAYCDN